MDISSIPDELLFIIEDVWLNKLISETIKNIMIVIAAKTDNNSNITELINSYVKSVFYNYPDMINTLRIKTEKEKEKDLEDLYKKVFE